MELNPNQAYLITAAGEISDISPVYGKPFKLEDVQKRVDGFIEVIKLNEIQIMIVNDEGKFCKEYNPIATAIAHLNGGIPIRDYICGDAVLCPSWMLP